MCGRRSKGSGQAQHLRRPLGRPEADPPRRKKVSCWSRAGCCWGWKSASKFQKELSIKLSVGISVNLVGNTPDCPACAQRLCSTAPTQALCSPHLQEDLTELGADLEQGVQVATVREHATGQEVVWLEGSVPPGATVGGGLHGPAEGCPVLLQPPMATFLGSALPGDHLWAQLCLLLGDAGAEGLALSHPVGLQGPVAKGAEGMLLSP